MHSFRPRELVKSVVIRCMPMLPNTLSLPLYWNKVSSVLALWGSLYFISGLRWRPRKILNIRPWEKNHWQTPLLTNIDNRQKTTFYLLQIQDYHSKSDLPAYHWIPQLLFDILFAPYWTTLKRHAECSFSPLGLFFLNTECLLFKRLID